MSRPKQRNNFPRRHGAGDRTPQSHQRSHRAKTSHRGGESRSREVYQPMARQRISSEELIMGRNCIQEVLRACPERLQEVFLAQSRDGERAGGDARRSSLREQIEKLGVPVRELRREELDAIVQSESHQGVVARVVPRAVLEFDDLLAQVAAQDSIGILALDGVLDPQNMGAILRAAECFGVSAVLWSKNRSAPLGPVVSKASVGASEIVPLCPVSNLHRALESLKEAGVWSIGAVVSPEALPLQSFEKPNKWVLVMGSEGEGLQSLIEKNLDFRVYISMLGSLSSLNVSQATAVMLHTLAL
jgi:23S rRNA (guanosine2251-2'-O)-methyltransferase